MQHTLDKVFVFFLCYILFFGNTNIFATKYLIPCLLIFCISGLLFYFDSNKMLFIGAICFFILCLFFPIAFYFFPLLVYDALYKRKYVYLLLYLIPCLPLLFHLKKYEFFLFLLLSFFSFYLGHNSFLLEENTEKIKRLLDDSRELALLSSMHQRELIEKHESEIHIATLQERNRIAREIHDNVGHMLSRSILLVGALKALSKEETLNEPINTLKETLDQAMNNIRESVHDLKDDSLDLEETIKSTLHYYSKYHIHFDYDAGNEIPREIKYCFISIIKEALSNTAKHSNATKINLIFREQPNGFQLLLEDNGFSTKTFSVEDIEHANGNGIGLLNMKERVQSFHGNLHITANNGFKIFIFIPKNTHEENTNESINCR